MILPTSTNQLAQLEAAIAGPRERLLAHPIYGALASLDDLHVFLEHHVFAVWDFMSLLKALQLRLTSVRLPWTPVGDPVVRRLINEIVLGEESDVTPDGGSASHFELYRDAMQQCGADVSRIVELLRQLELGADVSDALVDCGAPPAAAQFVNQTWQTVSSGRIHTIAAAFTYGREEVIPEMFRRLIDDLNRKFPGKLELFQYYLQRHVELDEDSHAPLARRMLTHLCGENPQRWREATAAATRAIEARIALWDGVVAALPNN